jgi:hypothetical protein
VQGIERPKALSCVFTVPSSSTMTKALCCEAFSMTSMMGALGEISDDVQVLGLAGTFYPLRNRLVWSTSIMGTVAPRATSSLASNTAEVEFPSPPFGLANTIVGMRTLF